jgi:NADH-quinone oxidoreductase subunit E
MAAEAEYKQEELGTILAAHKPSSASLIPLLQDLQAHLGYLPESAIQAAADHLDMSPSEVYGVATFYTQFRFVRPGKHTIRVCEGTACHVKGGHRLLDELVRLLGIQPGETTEDGRFTLETVACFGSCALSPVIVIDETVYGRVTADQVRKLVKEPS